MHSIPMRGAVAERELLFQSINALGAAIRSGALSPVELAEQFLARIDALDARLHAFLRVTRERALAEARAAEGAFRAGRDAGPLQGIPYAAKDLFDVQGIATTGGTTLLAEDIATADSAAVRSLSRAGMALLGKTHTVQLAYGLVGINNDQGTPHNPWKEAPYAPGGSSSGSAVAVASGLAPAALGTDTGGSVRVPAALCGIVGLKTTVGRVSRTGVYPLSKIFDSVGPLARSVEDAALLYQALMGEDPLDETTAGVRLHDPIRGLKDGVRGLRIAIGETLFFDDVTPEIERAVRETGAAFRSLGAQVESIAIPEVAEIWNEEKRSHLVAAEACALNRDLLDRHFDQLDPFVATRMIRGDKLRASDYIALFRRLMALRDRLSWTLRDIDAVLAPTAMVAARPLDSLRSPESYFEYNSQLFRNASVGNLLQLCGVSVPCGFTSDRLPIGLMIYAKPFQEDVALRVAYAYEQATEWKGRRPDLAWATAPAPQPTG
jgi:aspartyl-tRNA(Asn)/glutamyl-tRNA(Gln) amidotransferase subunit A